MSNQEAFMDLKYAEKGKGMSKAKWVWTKMAYLQVSGANYKLKFDRITRIAELFRRLSMCMGTDVLILLQWSLGRY